MQNNLGNFSNVAFLPYARFFAGHLGAWPKRPNDKSASVCGSVPSLVQQVHRWRYQSFITGRPARSAAMPMLFLLSGP